MTKYMLRFVGTDSYVKLSGKALRDVRMLNATMWKDRSEAEMVMSHSRHDLELVAIEIQTRRI